MKKKIEENKLYTFSELCDILGIKRSHVIEFLTEGCFITYHPEDKENMHELLGIKDSEKKRDVYKLSDIFNPTSGKID